MAANEESKDEASKGDAKSVSMSDKATGVSVNTTVTLTPPPGQTSNGEADGKKGEKPPVVTHHEARVQGKSFSYSVTTGLMPLKSESGEKEADIFFMAYTREDAGSPSERPLMFSFNGGPGSASVWLHLGALGPKRVKMLDDGSLPAPPYELVENEHAWLDDTDLVFIDPVGTGYSRPAKPELGKKFWSVQGDIESIAEFIRLYLTRYQRWSSPLFLVGESYGTTRAAGLAGHLIDRGIALNGIVLVSSILNFQTASFARGNDLPYVLFLPTYTATAWYHGRLEPALQADLNKTLAEAEKWAITKYAAALALGDSQSDSEREATLEQLSRYTGLDKRYLDNSHLRVPIFRFCKELLRDQKRTVGRLDSRIKGLDALPVADTPDHDPSMTAIRPPYTAAFNDYVRRQLGWESDSEYHILGGGIKSPWAWGIEHMGYPDTGEALRSAFAKNPYMKLFVASGYYDLATPYFATQYTLNHLGLDPSLRGNIQTGEYEAGHMMYIHTDSLAKLKTDVSAFLRFALSHE
jgi:carboxypeptidase C (cathepsin A)